MTKKYLIALTISFIFLSFGLTIVQLIFKMEDTAMTKGLLISFISIYLVNKYFK